MGGIEERIPCSKQRGEAGNEIAWKKEGPGAERLGTTRRAAQTRRRAVHPAAVRDKEAEVDRVFRRNVDFHPVSHGLPERERVQQLQVYRPPGSDTRRRAQESHRNCVQGDSPHPSPLPAGEGTRDRQQLYRKSPRDESRGLGVLVEGGRINGRLSRRTRAGDGRVGSAGAGRSSCASDSHGSRRDRAWRRSLSSSALRSSRG